MKNSQNPLLLFDVDGTICESGKRIMQDMSDVINALKNAGYTIGIVGGGTYERIITQLDGKIIPTHIFSECGSVYHMLDAPTSSTYKLIKSNDIRMVFEYPQINQLVKTCLNFISGVDYTVSGNFIDLRRGLVYVSLVGMSANDVERSEFIASDAVRGYRRELMRILEAKAEELGVGNKIEVCEGGSVGIAIYPKDWDKTQVLEVLDLGLYNSIYYFGDKYMKGGNDYRLINHPRITKGFGVDGLDQTQKILGLLLENGVI